MERVEIALACDERYFPGLLAAITSIIIGANENYAYHFHVLDGGIKKESIKLLTNTVTRFKGNFSIHIIAIDVDQLAALPKFYFSSYMAYARLLLQEIVDVDRIIYVDTDILFYKDISDLWKIDLQDKCCGVCIDAKVNTIRNDCPNYKKLGFTGDEPYFNSGLMVIDMQKFIANEIAIKTFTYLEENMDTCKYWDQSALNVTLAGLVLWIDKSWNFQIGTNQVSTETITSLLYGFNTNIHFVTKNKPWLTFSEDVSSSMFYVLLNTLNFPNPYTNDFFASKTKYFLRTKNTTVYLYLYTALYFFKKYSSNKKAAEKARNLSQYWKELYAQSFFLKNNKEYIQNIFTKWSQLITGKLID